MESLRITGSISYTYGHDLVTGDIHSNSARISIVQDRDPSGVFPTWSNIFASLDNAGTFVTDYRSHLSFENTKRFKVLRQTFIDLNPKFYYKAGLTNDKCQLSKEFDIFIPLKGMHCGWNVQATTSNIADYDKNPIYFIIRMAQNPSHVSLAYAANCRLRYRDF